jgi:hypothetical protein
MPGVEVKALNLAMTLVRGGKIITELSNGVQIREHTDPLREISENFSNYRQENRTRDLIT